MTTGATVGAMHGGSEPGEVHVTRHLFSRSVCPGKRLVPVAIHAGAVLDFIGKQSGLDRETKGERRKSEPGTNITSNAHTELRLETPLLFSVHPLAIALHFLPNRVTSRLEAQARKCAREMVTARCHGRILTLPPGRARPGRSSVNEQTALSRLSALTLPTWLRPRTGNAARIWTVLRRLIRR